MKEIIIGGLVALLVLFVFEVCQSGKNASNVQPTSSIPKNAPTGTHGPPPVTRLIAEEKSSVRRHHESAEQYYIVITEEITEEEVTR